MCASAGGVLGSSLCRRGSTVTAHRRSGPAASRRLRGRRPRGRRLQPVTRPG